MQLSNYISEKNEKNLTTLNQNLKNSDFRSQTKMASESGVTRCHGQIFLRYASDPELQIHENSADLRRRSFFSPRFKFEWTTYQRDQLFIRL